ncbi:hypothetical protein CRUP_028225 [Coryphaenoides rupestris]|nr:hypothetical protein CRUP_028225 [Coryphaenoides rupestris]
MSTISLPMPGGPLGGPQVHRQPGARVQAEGTAPHLAAPLHVHILRRHSLHALVSGPVSGRRPVQVGRRRHPAAGLL